MLLVLSFQVYSGVQSYLIATFYDFPLLFGESFQSGDGIKAYSAPTSVPPAASAAAAATPLRRKFATLAEII